MVRAPSTRPQPTAGLIDIKCPKRYHHSVMPGARGQARVPCRYCREDKSVMVYHWFDLASGELVETQRFASVRAFLARREGEQSGGCTNVLRKSAVRVGSDQRVPAGRGDTRQRSASAHRTAPDRVPVIFNFARNLSVDSVLQSASLQWFRNDTIINGANSSSYYAGLAGSYTVKYKNNCGYGPVSNAFNFPADTLSQTITFPHTDTIAMSPAAKIVLPATASSGLPVFYQRISGPGNVVNDTLFISGVGTIIIKALQPGDDVYSSAAPVYDIIM